MEKTSNTGIVLFACMNIKFVRTFRHIYVIQKLCCCILPVSNCLASMPGSNCLFLIYGFYFVVPIGLDLAVLFLLYGSYC